MFRFLLPVALIAMAARPAPSQIVLNEIVAQNHAGLQDQDGESPDWIELRNLGGTPVNLSGWFLTDDPALPGKWAFPSISLPGGGYLVVFASGKNRAIPGQELHTNFELDSSGEYLALVQPGGSTASAMTPMFPPQHPDVSYGFAGTGTSTRVFSGSPTPNAVNGNGTTIVIDPLATPSAPGNNDNIVVSAATLTPPSVTILQVVFRYRINYGVEAALPMGFVAGRWIGTIPATASGPGDFVRWRITVLDSLGLTSKSPLYPVAASSPEYHGVMIPDPSVTSSLGIFYWCVQSPPAATTSTGTRCCVSYLGEFYDNVDVRLRGGSSSSWPKVSFKFDFNPGYHFNYNPSVERVEEVNLNSAYGDKAFIRQILSYELYDAAGAPGSVAFPIRVQQNKTFHSVATFVEQPDKRMLSRAGLDSRGALYKMYNECTSSTSSVEKQTRLAENNTDLDALVNGVLLSGAALDAFLFDNVDLPKVINYLAATSLIHDNDHVAKNYYLYRDSEGDREWCFLPWDKDLTFGRNYTLTGGVLNDTIWSNNDPYSHPLFGDVLHPKVDGPWNRFIDAIYRSPKARSMFLRRLRTLLDAHLLPPGTPSAQVPLETRIAALQAQMLPDCNLDQTVWGVPGWGSPALTFLAASNQLVTSYFPTRRTHLYTTHGPGGTALIPPAQTATPRVRIGLIEANATNPATSFVQLHNCEAFAVDVSRWVLFGPASMVLPKGSVIPASGTLYVAADVFALRNRTISPRGGEGHLVLGPWSGTLSSNASLQLLTPTFQLVDSTGEIALSVTTNGTGNLNLSVQGADPGAELWITFSTQVSTAPGCGPVLGLGADAFFPLLYPLGTVPFHVLADAAGTFSFVAPPSSIPLFLTIDIRALARGVSGNFRFSAIRRITF